MSPQSACCCQARRPTSPPRSIPPFLLTLLRSLRLPITPLFSGWRQGTCDDRGVSTGHGDLLLRLFPLARGVDTFLPALGLHQSILCALRVHIPAHQELLLSSLTGLWLHRFMEREKGLCECFPHPSSLSHRPTAPPPQITQIPHCVSFPQSFYQGAIILNCAYIKG